MRILINNFTLPNHVLFLVVTLLFFGKSLLAMDSVVVSETEQIKVLEQRHLDCWLDVGSQLEVHDILPLLYTPNYDYQNATDKVIRDDKLVGNNLWTKFAVLNRDSTSNWYVLEIPDFHIYEVELFSVKGAVITRLGLQGYTIPFVTREYEYKNPCFTLVPADVDYYILRLFSNNRCNYKLQLVHPGLRFSFTTYEYISLGFFYGILMILIVYNLSHFFLVRQRVYILYTCYILSFVMYSLKNNGLGFQYLWPSFTIFNYINDFFFLIFVVLFSVFSDHFLALKRRLPYLRKWLYLSTAIYVVFYFYETYSKGYNEINTWSQLLPFTVVIFSSITLFRKGYKEVRFFILGHMFLVLGVVIHTLAIYEVWPDGPLGVYSFDRGFVIEVFFFSVALADKIRINSAKRISLQAELIVEQNRNAVLKDKVNRELEHKVLERTLQLSAKNDELEKMTEQFSAMNVKLDKSVWELNKEMKRSLKRELFKRKLSYVEFLKIFPSDVSCGQYLEELKWGAGFMCIKCGNQKWNEGQESLSRKCTKCNARETVTANTFFHGIRMPLVKALYLTYLFVSFDREIFLKDLEVEIGMSSSSLSTFRKKVKLRVRTFNLKEISLDLIIFNTL